MLHDYLETVPQIGLVEWIGLSPESRGEILSVEQVEAVVGQGLTGDHPSKSKTGGDRQVTLVQKEHLTVVTQLIQNGEVTPELLRRNLLVSGINLVSLKKQTFRIGEVVLQGTGNCAPCSRMEENLGEGGYQAMRGHGGITAKVILDGTIRVGDQIEFVDDSETG